MSRAHFIVGTAALLYIGGTVYDLWRERVERQPVNPQAIAAFKEIAASCARETPQTARCRQALAEMTTCTSDTSWPCAAEDHHRALAQAGFTLPPLHR